MFKSQRTYDPGHNRNGIYYTKIAYLWPQEWSQAPKPSRNRLLNHEKKLLVYYQKNFRSLKKFITNIHDAQPQKLQHRKLYSQIISRYKKDYLRYQLFSSCCPEVMITSKNLQSLKIWSDVFTTYFQDALLFNVRYLRSVKVLELDLETYSTEILRKLRYIRSLGSMQINMNSTMDFGGLQRLVTDLRFSLKKITLVGELKPPPEYEKEYYDTNSMLKTISKLPNLRQFNFDAKIVKDFDINDMPFGILNERNICYNVRMATYDQDLTFSQANIAGLSSLEFLGINFKQEWSEEELKYNAFQQVRLKYEQNAKSVLLISFFNPKQSNISSLLEVCENIQTLNFTVSHISNISFNRIKNLKKIKHAFIQTDHISEDFKADFFNNLAYCANKLHSVSLQFFGTSPSQDDQHLLFFFEQCAYSLKHFTLFVPNSLQIFYGGITKLKQLESLSLFASDLPNQYFYDSNQECWVKNEELNLKPILKSQTALKRLALSLSGCDLSVINNEFTHMKALQKVRLDTWTMNVKDNWFEGLYNLSNLKHLELAIRFGKYKWNQLQDKLAIISALQTFKLKLNTSYKPKVEEMVEILRNIMKNLKGLELIAFSEWDYPKVIWTLFRGNKNWTEEINSFFVEDFEFSTELVYKTYYF